MSYWIAQELRRRREELGISTAIVAAIMDVNQETIRRLERGHAYGRDIDRAVTYYAALAGTTPAALWTEAAMRFGLQGIVSRPDREEIPQTLRSLLPVEDEPCEAND